MKNLKFVSSIALILAVVSLNSCKKTASNQLKSSTIQLKAITKSLNLKSSNSFAITAANVNIVSLQIEENSGNDGENVNGGNDKNNNDKATDGSDNETEGSDSTSEDILLAGPYSLDISVGTASIGEVKVYPGTFKKVNFSFQTSNSALYSGNSIVIEGNYTASTGTVIPFTISSTFSQRIQLPLAGNGISVTANSSKVINIAFDVNNWLSGVNFASATITNNEILIDANNNSDLLSAFESNLAKYIDAEGE